jgi:macrolide transport system ATP-binding/permease protein
MDSVWRDLKYGIRALLRSPGFTFVAVLSLALGIGANTAIFTLTNAVFLSPLPVQDPSHVLELFTVDNATTTTGGPATRRTSMSWLNYKDLRDQSDAFTGLTAFILTNTTLTGHGEAKQQFAMLVSANYFDVLGVKPMLGRSFFPDEDRSDGGNTVAVLSHAMWMRLFGGDPSAVGKSIEMNGTSYTIIGVAPPNFKGTVTVGTADLAWVPISMHTQTLPGQLDALMNERRMRMINVFGRLKPDVSQARALASLKTLAANLEQQYPRANRGRTVDVSSVSDAALGFLPRDVMTQATLALTAVVALVLLIACVNLANLLLARSAKRAREMGIRTALGAGRSRLVRQLLTESLLISAAGGAVGLLLGLAGTQLLWSLRPAFMAQASLPMGLDLRVFAFTAGVTLFTGLLFGLAPATRMSIATLSEILKTGGRGGSEAFSRSRLRSALVIGEVALALVALAGAGLLIRSMDHVQKINPGFETHNLLAVDFDTSPRHFTPERGLQFYQSVLAKVRTAPGVRSAALASSRPLGGGILATLLAEGRESDPNYRGTLTLMIQASPEYFDTTRIPIIQGRGFTPFDRQGSRPVAVITEAMARHFWPGQNAVGKRFRSAIATTEPVEVVGVSGNSTAGNIGEEPQPIAFVPLDQNYQSFVSLLVRTNGNPESVMPTVLRHVQALDSNMALLQPQTIQEVIAQGLWAPRMAAALFGIFGLLGLLLAAVGIYGVMAYMVSQRTNEIGLRMALGARPSSVLILVTKQGMRLVGMGIGLGIVAAVVLTRLMVNLLFNVSTFDPVTYGSVSVFVLAIAFLASWLPARRAARIDPVLALRQE